MPVGLGGSINLGSGTAFLYVDASGMRRGLLQAERAMTQFQRKQEATRDALRKSAQADMTRGFATGGASVVQSEAFIKLEKRVAQAADAATARIKKSYRDRGKAIADNARIASVAQAKIAAFEKTLADATRERNRLDARATGMQRRLSFSATDPRYVGGKARDALELDLGDAIADINRLDRAMTHAATNISAQQKVIAAAGVVASDKVIAANRREQLSINALEGALKKQSVAMRALASGAGPQFEKLAESSEAAGRRQVQAMKNVAQAERAVEEARRRRKSASGDAPVAAAIKAEESAIRRLNKMNKDYETARVGQIRAERNFTNAFIANADARIKKANQEADGVTKAKQRESDAARQAEIVQTQRGVGAAQSAAIAATTIIGGATNAWVDYEKQLYNVLSISEDASLSIDSMKEDIDNLSVSLGKAPEELAAGLYSIVQAGIQGEAAMEVLRVSAEAAVAGMTDVETAAKPLIGVLNAYGLEAEKASDVSDVLFAAVTHGIFSFEDLSSQLGDNLSNAAALNVELEELAASYVVLTRRSNSLAESTTQVNAVINSFMKPSVELETAFQNLTGESATLYFRTHDLGEVLEIVNRLFKENADVAGRLFPNLRAIRGIFGLTAEEAHDFAVEMEFMKNSAIGMREAVLNVQMQALSFQFSQAREQARQAAIALGVELAPGILFIAKVAGEAAQKLAAFLGSMKGIPGITIGIGGGFLIAAASIARFVGFLDDGVQGVKKLGKELQRLYGWIIKSQRAMLLLRLAFNPITLAAGLLAFGIVKSIRDFQKHSRAVKEAAEALKILDDTIAKLKGSRNFTIEQEQQVDVIRQQIQDVLTMNQFLADNWGKNVEKTAEGLFLMTVAVDTHGNAVKQLAVDYETLSDTFEKTLDPDEQKRLSDAMETILSTEGLDVPNFFKEFGTLFAQMQRGDILPQDVLAQLESWAAKANELTKDWLRQKNALTSVGDELVNVDEFFGTLETTANDTRQAMQGLVKSFYEANGVMIDFTDPLSAVNSLLGTMGDGAITTIARLAKLGQIQLTPDETAGINLLAQMENARARIDDVNTAIQESQARMSEWQSIISLVADTVGTSANNYSELAAMAERFGLEQSEVNDIQKAAIYLNEQSKSSIADEQLATARALPDLARFVAQHEKLREEYFALDEGARTAAEALKDQNTQMLLMLAVLMKLVEVMKPGTFPEEFTTKFYADVSAVDAGTAHMLERWGLLPEEFTTKVAVDVDPSLDTLDELDAAIAEAQSGLDYMQKSGFGQFNEQLKARQQEVIDALTKRKHDIELGIVVSKDTEIPTILSGIEDAADLGEDAIAELEEAWTSAFESMEHSTADASKELADAIPDLYRAAAALDDFTDPLTFLTKKFHTFEDNIEDVLLKGEALSDLDFGFDAAQRGALVLSRDLKETEHRIAAINDEIENNQDDMSKWENTISLIDDTVGDTTDTMSQYKQALAEGRITQEEFDDAVKSGDAHFAFEKLNQLLNTNRITQEEYDKIVKASIWLRQRSVGGVLDERAEIAKSLPFLAKYIAHHDALDGKMKDATDAQRGLIAAVNDESVQMALSTGLMLKELEKQGIAAEGSADKYLRAVAAANPAVASVLRDINFLEGEHDVELNIVLDAQSQATIAELDSLLATWAAEAAQAKVVLQSDPGNALALQQLQQATAKLDELQRAKAIIYIESQAGRAFETLRGIEDVILRINEAGDLTISGDDAAVQIVLEQLRDIGIDPKAVKIVPEFDGTPQEAVDAASEGQPTPTMEAEVVATDAAVEPGVAPEFDDLSIKVTADYSAAMTALNAFKADLLIKFEEFVVLAQNYGTYAGESYAFALETALTESGTDMEMALLEGPGKQLRLSASTFTNYGAFAGHSFDIGVARGMVNTQGIAAIDRAARFVALRAYYGALRALISRSPSKRGVEVGQTFTQGFALGILSEEQQAIAAAERVAKNTASAMSGAIDTGFDQRALSAGRALPVSRSGVAPAMSAAGSTTNSHSTVLDLDVHVNGAQSPEATAKAVTDEVWQMLHQGFVTMDARTRR